MVLQGVVEVLGEPRRDTLPPVLGGRDSCHGDSGGPLWRWEQVKINFMNIIKKQNENP